MTPGTYSNAVKSGLQYRTSQSTTPNTPEPFLRQRGEQIPNVQYHVTELERPKYPLFEKNSNKKNLFLIGSSTLKRMSARKMTTNSITTKVKTIRGGRIRDIENCLIEHISDGKLDCVDVIAVHVGTNNVSDRDTVRTIINDYKNLIHTDHVHTNVDGAKVLSHNIISCVNTMLRLYDSNSQFEQNFYSERITGRRYAPLETTNQDYQHPHSFRPNVWN
ncbi:Hypothetical predicted protein [Mytilus galloprovincialis]|uniref:Uncharacterized protein n=1 Tax=Mytilus galloprovincialis TaxID=29158 RepID=A0A8B6BP37_MYTGA|nr:Hypothetical predicted protein [Mytilus galloprovincialis]